MGARRRLLRALLAWPLALVILFEEWGWEPLQRLLGWLARWRAIAWLESRIAALPPYGALALYAVPALSVLPVKLLLLTWIAGGHAVLGTVLIVLVKVLGTAVVARLFYLTKPALMQLGWFASLYARWMRWTGALLAQVRASALWRQARAWRLQVRNAITRWRARMTTPR